MQPEETTVGIDLGTSNSVCYFFRNGQYQSLAITAQSHLLPSVVEYRPDKTVGETARRMANHADKYIVLNTKRVLGYNYNSLRVSNNPDICNVRMSAAPDGKVQFVDEETQKVYTPVSVATDILKEILERVYRATECKISRLVITIPADFKQEQRLATKEAIRNAGFKDDQFRILNEPTAAALAYCINEPNTTKNIIVYDFGGGTFDCTVLHIEDYHFNILSHDGDEGIGGVLLDKILFDYCIDYCMREFGRSPLPNPNSRLYLKKQRKLLNLCEEAKITLSVAFEADIPLYDFERELDAEEFADDEEKMNIHIHDTLLAQLFYNNIKKTIDIMDRAIQQAGLTRNQINRVLLVGGSCRIKCAKKMITEHFGNENIICREVNPDEVVALGACIYSKMWKDSQDGQLTLNKHPIFIDELTSVTLNIQISPDLCYPILKKGTRINGSDITILFKDNAKTGCTVYNLYEGDSAETVNGCNDVKKCTLLKSILIHYAPEDIGPNGVEYLFVFNIENDGVLTLELHDRRTGKVYLPKETIGY